MTARFHIDDSRDDAARFLFSYLSWHRVELWCGYDAGCRQAPL